MRLALRNRLEESLGARLTTIQPLAGGCLSSCVRLGLSDSRDVVVKFGAGHFLLEARMLSDLANALSSFLADITIDERHCFRIPRVYHADEDMLAMEWIESERVVSKTSYYNAGCLLARLHACSSDSFGYDYDTPLGNLLQDNRRCSSWTHFYRDRRLLPLGERCLAAGELDADLHKSLLRFTERLDDLLAGRESVRPSLLHGDLWGGNMLFSEHSLGALLDPALYYGDGQVDLAMLRLFPCCDESFFEGYRATTMEPIERASESLYMDVYSIYPLLVHCLFFGRRYQASLARVLHRYL